MTDLVTPAAIDAAWAVSTTWEFPREEKMLVRAEIEASAKYIAAEALRQAERRIAARYDQLSRDPEAEITPICQVMDGLDIAGYIVAEMADELEAGAR